MITFLVLFSLILVFMEAEAWVNYGAIIISKPVLIVPLIFGFCGQLLVTMFRWVKETDEE